MKSIYFLLPFLLTAFIGITPLSTRCVNAYPGMQTVRQPDGTTLNVRVVGDESYHVTFSEDGSPLVQNEHGWYVAANSIAVSKGQLMKRLEGRGKVTTSFPTLGEQRALVVLVEFSDNSFSMANPNEFYSMMLNEEGYSLDGATGSARDYFIDNSHGAFVPEFDVYGPVKLSGTIADYGVNDSWGYDMHPQLMAIEACRLLDDEIDFSLYDRDGDGKIDNVFFYYAGYGENDGGGANTIWPHSTLLSLVYPNKFFFDGVELDRYACSNELHSETRDGLVDGIGTFCHEFSHVLGLPDLYSTTFINLETPGTWDIMDTGNYNNNGLTPANLSSFERIALDWLEPLALDFGDITLHPLQDSNEAYIYECNNPDEYFLFENRQQTGFDAYLPGHGMLVWHISFNQAVWDDNAVNSYFWSQHVDLVEADNKGGEGSREGDAFPGTSGNTEYSRFSTPGFTGQSQVLIPYALRNIAETPQGDITFTVGDPSLSAVGCVEMSGDDELGTCFDLTGRRVSGARPEKGIYIKNGKKILIKN